jgi:hypothetical protein
MWSLPNLPMAGGAGVLGQLGVETLSRHPILGEQFWR